MLRNPQLTWTSPKSVNSPLRWTPRLGSQNSSSFSQTLVLKNCLHVVVRKAIEKFHLNFLSGDGLLSGAVLRVIFRFQSDHSALSGKGKTASGDGEARGTAKPTLKSVTRPFLYGGFTFSGAVEWCCLIYFFWHRGPLCTWRF